MSCCAAAGSLRSDASIGGHDVINGSCCASDQSMMIPATVNWRNSCGCGDSGSWIRYGRETHFGTPQINHSFTHDVRWIVREKGCAS